MSSDLILLIDFRNEAKTLREQSEWSSINQKGIMS